MAQTGAIQSLTRRPSALILYAPGVSVHLIPGEKGFVTERSLTSNPEVPHFDGIRPWSPFFKPIFAARLFFSFIECRKFFFASDLPVLMYIAGSKTDLYADSVELRRWARFQNRKGVLLEAIKCRGAKHELDNEAEPTGSTVRGSTVVWLRNKLFIRRAARTGSSWFERLLYFPVTFFFDTTTNSIKAEAKFLRYRTYL